MFLDVIFISYDEPNAEENYGNLLQKIPYAKRIHGVKGIAKAHLEAAKIASTSHFFCIDGDNIIKDDFNFEKILDFQYSDQRIHVWGCENSVNGLEYGYGGVKLFPTDIVRNSTHHSVDFCTSVAAANHGFRFHKEIASTTFFNTSPFNAWKSGFRECAKLSSGIIENQNVDETINRLSVWLSVGLDVLYGNYAILGARMGTELGLFHSTKRSIHKLPLLFDKSLDDINDFDKCKEIFDKQVKNKDPNMLIEEYGRRLSSYLSPSPVLYPIELSRHFKKTIYNL